MNQNNNNAYAYYMAMSEKNVTDLERYLHANVAFTSPFAHVTGKAPFVETLKGFVNAFNSLKIHSVFGSDDQSAVVYDVEFHGIGAIPTVAIMQFKDGLIIKITIFFDARPFDRK